MKDATILLLFGMAMSGASGFMTYLATEKPAAAGAVVLGLLAIMLWIEMAVRMSGR